MALRAYTQDEIIDSSIGDDVYLQPDVDKELDGFKEKIAKLEEEIEKLKKEEKLTRESQ